MNISEKIEELEAALAAIKAQVAKAQKPEIRTVKIGNLEWQADVPRRKFTWQEAKDYAASLGDGWRLPTIQELLTLVDYTTHRPACSVFPDCPSEWFWSSSPYDNADAWSVYFGFGLVDFLSRHHGNAVRCVRDVSVTP